MIEAATVFWSLWLCQNDGVLTINKYRPLCMLFLGEPTIGNLFSNALN
jgi:hypothetical protein